MGLDSIIYATSNINAILGSALGYAQDKNNGVNTEAAVANLGMNLANGLVRNFAAKNIQENSGSYLGYAINANAGYNNSDANAKAAAGLLGASLLTSPYGIFGGMMTPYSTLYGCGPYGGGFYNSGFFGRSCGCNYPFMFTGPTMFGVNGFWC